MYSSSLPLLITFLSSVIIVFSITKRANAIPSVVAPANLTTLKLVQIIARHGDRAPILPYPTDPYKNASVYSINGWGELSELGAKQVYELGRYIRQRYDGFLPKKYRKRDILTLSSDVDRAIMSAESNLAGLYELGPLPRSRDIFKEWQPVPIHTIPKEEDTFIEAKADCPKHLSLFKAYMNSEEHMSFLAENKEFTDFVADMSGLVEIKDDFEYIFRVQDSLQCQFSHNLTFPAWVNSTVFERLQQFKALSFVWPVKSFEMKRLRVGPLLERLVGKMRGKVEAAMNETTLDEDEEIPPYQDPIAYRKMYVYSGHDSTISSLLSVLSPFETMPQPPYASALIIELHRMPESGEYFIELLYKNNTTQEPHRLDLSSFCATASSSPSMTFYCSFENFSKNAEAYIPTNWKDECQLQALALSSSSPSFYSGASGKLRLMETTARRDDDDDGVQIVLMHPLGIAAPGLSAFAISVIAVSSLLASAVILTSFLNKNRTRIGAVSRTSQIPGDQYQHLS